MIDIEPKQVNLTHIKKVTMEATSFHGLEEELDCPRTGLPFLSCDRLSSCRTERIETPGGEERIREEKRMERW